MSTLRLYDKTGFTLIEVLIAMISSSIIATGIYQIFHSNQDSYLYQNNSVNMIQELRAGLYQISKDIRSSGYNPSRGTFLGNGIRKEDIGFVKNFEANIFEEDVKYSEDTTKIAMTMDKNDDGKIEDNNMDEDSEDGEKGERIAYRLFENKLLRFNSETYAESKDINKSWEILVGNIEVLNFVFLDANGEKIKNEDELHNIKSVEVALIVRSSSKNHNKKDGYIFRNRQGEAICDDCLNSKYRYKMFNSRIKLRNSRGYRN